MAGNASPDSASFTGEEFLPLMRVIQASDRLISVAIWKRPFPSLAGLREAVGSEEAFAVCYATASRFPKGSRHSEH